LKNLQPDGYAKPEFNILLDSKSAIAISKDEGGYHILLIITDGEVTNDELTREAIVRASSHAISIVIIGVGDGPFGTKAAPASAPLHHFTTILQGTPVVPPARHHFQEIYYIS
jgi:hypothetical protein